MVLGGELNPGQRVTVDVADGELVFRVGSQEIEPNTVAEAETPAGV
jgi:hypothetical protein